MDEAKTPRVFLQARFTHCATPGIPDFKSRQKGPLPTVRPPSRPRTSRPGGRRLWQLCQLGGDTLFPPRVPGLQRAAARGHEGAAPRARPPRLAQRPRPRRWNQEAVTWGGADWLLVAGIGAASKLRRRAESTRAQCPRCCAAPRSTSVLSVRALSVALSGSPPPCCLGHSRRRGCCWTPGLCAADACHQLPVGQPVVLRRALVLAHRIEPAVGLLRSSPAGSKSLRLQGFAVG